MAFTVGQHVWATVQQGTGSTMTKQEGVIRQVLPDDMYQVFVVGLVLTLSELDLTEKTDG